MRGRWSRAAAGSRGSIAGRLWLGGTHATQSALGAIESLYTLAGSSSVYTANVLDRRLRDARTAVQHVMTQIVNYELAGKQYMGLPVADSVWSFDYRPGDPE